MQTFVNQKTKLEVYPLFDRKPVQAISNVKPSMLVQDLRSCTGMDDLMNDSRLWPPDYYNGHPPARNGGYCSILLYSLYFTHTLFLYYFMFTVFVINRTTRRADKDTTSLASEALIYKQAVSSTSPSTLDIPLS